VSAALDEATHDPITLGKHVLDGDPDVREAGAKLADDPLQPLAVQSLRRLSGGAAIGAIRGNQLVDGGEIAPLEYRREASSDEGLVLIGRHRALLSQTADCG
jgi:hypothetical protein